MLLFQRRFHEGLASGAIKITFRLWPTARVKAGSRYRCHPIGVLEVDGVDRILVKEISEEDAKCSGFSGRAELLEYLQGFSQTPLGERSELYRVRLHFGGDGDRVSLALETRMSQAEVAGIAERLRRMDATGKSGSWTRQTLSLIEAHPRIAASKLAKMVGRETAPFKADVVKLKKLGLTQSFEVGYEISPRGRVFLERTGYDSGVRC